MNTHNKLDILVYILIIFLISFLTFIGSIFICLCLILYLYRNLKECEKNEKNTNTN